MTELLFLVDSYTREFQAHVTELADDGVVLDRTAFYAGGGGQPCDTGVLVAGEARFQVTRVGRKDGKIVHQIQGPPPQIGSEVQGVLDWERRYLLMRTHSALHILCGVVWRDFGAKVTGGDMQPGTARMDFELDQMTSQFAEEVSEKINAEVKAARPVHVGNLTREEAERDPDLIRTKINLHRTGLLRGSREGNSGYSRLQHLLLNLSPHSILYSGYGREFAGVGAVDPRLGSAAFKFQDSGAGQQLQVYAVVGQGGYKLGQQASRNRNRAFFLDHSPNPSCYANLQIGSRKLEHRLVGTEKHVLGDRQGRSSCHRPTHDAQAAAQIFLKTG